MFFFCKQLAYQVWLIHHVMLVLVIGQFTHVTPLYPQSINCLMFSQAPLPLER